MAAYGGRVGSLLKCGVDHLQYSGKVAVDLVVPKPQNTKSTPFEAAGTNRIARGVVIKIVLTAINFDNEPVLETDKIDDVIVARRLPTKMKSALAP